MGSCTSKPSANPTLSFPDSNSHSSPSGELEGASNGGSRSHSSSITGENPHGEQDNGINTHPSFRSLLSKKSLVRSLGLGGSNSTLSRFFKRSFLPLSPVKCVKAVLTRGHCSVKSHKDAIPERGERVRG